MPVDQPTHQGNATAALRNGNTVVTTFVEYKCAYLIHLPYIAHSAISWVGKPISGVFQLVVQKGGNSQVFFKFPVAEVSQG